jgi:methyl-accepting chemotaxis protein
VQASATLVRDAQAAKAAGAATADASAASAFVLMAAMVGAAAVLAIALGAVMVRAVTRPLSGLETAMRRIAGGETQTPVPYLDRGYEIGAMAGAVEVFRANAERLETLAEERRLAEDAAAEERRVLSEAIGSVVDAAAEGDFARRIDATFRNEETRALAAGVNRLVEATQGGLDALRAALAALARADLTYRIPQEMRGAFAELRDDTHATMDSLGALIGRIRKTAATAVERSGEIAEHARELSSRAENEAASLEETSAAMEEMSASISANASALREAESLASDATARSQEGAAAAGNARGAVDRIADSAAKIGAITGVIESISFQTNLLALNASVEAARAGEAGKGFAVVASEVRTLAQRSAEAAKEIAGLIRASGDRVKDGVDEVARTAAALDQIDASIGPLVAKLTEVSSAGREQSSGVSAVSATVASLDRDVQSNAAMADRFARASEELLDEMRGLSEATAAFRVDNSGATLAA